MTSIWNFVLRNRATIQDVSVLAGILAVLTYLAFELDIFLSETSLTAAESRFALNESLFLGTILILGLLVLAIRRYRDLRSEIDRRTIAEHKARELAYQDPLTGLANRRQFEVALARAIRTPPEIGRSHGLFMLDLNGFKRINDAFGHGVGDEVLIVVAQRLLTSVRKRDLVARLGGDEFVVLARDLLGPEAASRVANRMIEELTAPIVTGPNRHEIGAGIGIVLLPDDALTSEDALRKADVALYRAKAERRSALRFFEAEMDRHLRERDELEQSLKDTLRNHRVKANFRPTLNLRTGAVTAFEAIPYCENGNGREIPLERLLPIAEETGLVHELARQVLHDACKAATGWPPTITLSIDIFPGQIKDAHLGQSILTTLRECGVDPARLEIEIAESTLVHELEAAKIALAPLRQAGVGIVLDNFGTGYSTLQHMREFRIDKVKIAQRLMEDMDDVETQRMVCALAGLGQGLGVPVAAKGVSDAASSADLIEAGIEQVQKERETVSASQAAAMLRATFPSDFHTRTELEKA